MNWRCTIFSVGVVLIIVLLLLGYGVVYTDRKITEVILFVSTTGVALYLISFLPICWCRSYVNRKSEEFGLSEVESRRWRLYCILTGVFGILAFYLKVVKRKNNTSVWGGLGGEVTFNSKAPAPI